MKKILVKAALSEGTGILDYVPISLVKTDIDCFVIKLKRLSIAL